METTVGAAAVPSLMPVLSNNLRVWAAVRWNWSMAQSINACEINGNLTNLPPWSHSARLIECFHSEDEDAYRLPLWFCCGEKRYGTFRKAIAQKFRFCLIVSGCGRGSF